MKTHLSKLALGAASMFLATSAIAYQDLDDRLDVLEKEMKEISARNPQGTVGAGFTTARPDTVGNNWFIFADVIYWHPKMGGTEFAITYNTSDFISLPPIVNNAALSHRPDGDYKENDFGWDLGLKAGLGYKTPHDSWDILGRYTWFQSHSTKQSRKDFPAAIIPLKLSTGLTPGFSAVNHAKSTVDIGYNNIDLELARNYFISKDFAVRPHLSLKGSWIDLKQKVYYVQTQNPDLSALVFEFETPEFKADLKSNFWGVGPRFGLDTRYFLGNNVNFFGDFAAAILYGHFKTSEKDHIPNAVPGGLLPPDIAQQLQELFNLGLSAPNRSLKHNFHQFVPFAQMQLGLEWNKYLNNNKQHIRLKAGYEVQYYWRANQMGDLGDRADTLTITSISVNPPSIARAVRGRHQNNHGSKDLMFYGITAEARLDF